MRAQSRVYGAHSWTSYPSTTLHREVKHHPAYNCICLREASLAIIVVRASTRHRACVYVMAIWIVDDLFSLKDLQDLYDIKHECSEA
jgi:hypothetical protein